MKGIMKRVLSLIFLLAFMLPCFSLPVTATENNGAPFWSEEYYRVHDSLKDLSDPERNALDEMCIDFMAAHEADLVLLSVLPQEYEGSSLRELAEAYYTDYEFGYGPEKSGIVYICDMTMGKAEYALFGDAARLVDPYYLELAAEAALDLYSVSGIYGVLYSGGKFVIDYFDDGGIAPEASEGEVRTETGEAPFDLSLPRVVDRADIFSDQEEQEIERRIYEILYEIGRDIVVVTDKSAGGKTKTAYADDFFDYGGYGCGEEREGACLFICMDPDDRGFWVSLSGPGTRGPYNETIANEMDAVLQGFLREGRYAEGVIDWIGNLYRLLTTGAPFRPSWLSESEDRTERFHDGQAARVDDAAHVLTEEERLALTEKAQSIAQENDVDVALHIARDPGGDVRIEDYAERYYRHMGYGYGENYDGIALICLIRYGGEYDAMLYTSGSGGEKLTAVNEKRLLGFYEDKLKYSEPTDYSGAFDLYLDKLKAMEKSGRVPRSGGYWLFVCIGGLIIGLIFGIVTIVRAMNHMETVAKSSGADVYLRSGSLRVGGRDRYLNTTKDRRYAPERDRSRSGGSGGRSSYSGGHSSSSGRSHSGSGRSF